MEKNNIKTTEIAKQNNNKKTKATKVSDQKLNWGFWILSFFLPILGYIFYLVWQTKKPLKSKSCGWGSLIGSVFYIVVAIIIILIIGKVRYR